MKPLEKTGRQNKIMNLYPLYRAAPINMMERFWIYLRLRLSSYEVIASHVPPSGKILDLGCGFGMLSIYLALSSPERCIKKAFILLLILFLLFLV